MSLEKTGFKFVIYPKYLVTKGIYFKSTLPQYGIVLFKGNIKEDQITVVPGREQKLYQTYFVLNEGKLQFREANNPLRRWTQRKIAVYDHGEELGCLMLNIEDYICNYEDYGSKYYNQQVKIAEDVEFQFELFLASTDSELSEVLMEYRGESSIKTPLTIVSRDRKQEEEEDIDTILAETKIIHSQLYSPAVVPSSRKHIKDDEEEEEEEQSMRSSIPLTSPPPKKSFSISLRAVPVKTINNQSNAPFSSEFTAYKDYCSLSGRDRLVILLFGAVSIVMIYLSMLPIKKI